MINGRHLVRDTVLEMYVIWLRVGCSISHGVGKRSPSVSNTRDYCCLDLKLEFRQTEISTRIRVTLYDDVCKDSHIGFQFKPKVQNIYFR